MGQIKIPNLSVSIEGPGVRFKQENIWEENACFGRVP